MAEIIIIISVILMLLLTLIQQATVRLSRAEETIIDIDFLFFRLILYPDRKKRTSKRTRKRAQIKEKIRRILLTRRALCYIIERSDIIIYSIDVPLNCKHPAVMPTKEGAVYAVLGVILAYVKAHARSLRYYDIPHVPSSAINTKRSAFDISFRFMLFELITALYIYKHGFSKNKNKAGL